MVVLPLVGIRMHPQLILIIIVVNIINYNSNYDYGNALGTPLFAPHALTL